MKKLAIALVVLAAPGVAAASGTTLHLTEKQTFQQIVDNGAKGESPGDMRTFGGDVFQSGKRVGHARIRLAQGRTCDDVQCAGRSSLIANTLLGKDASLTAK